MLQRIIIPWGIGMAILGIVIMLICNLMNSYEPKEKWGAVGKAVVELIVVVIIGIMIL